MNSGVTMIAAPSERAYPLTDAAEALRMSEAGHFGGKLVLVAG